MKKDSSEEIDDVGKIVTDYVEAKNNDLSAGKEEYVAKASSDAAAEEARSLCNTVDFLIAARAEVTKKMKRKRRKKHGSSVRTVRNLDPTDMQSLLESASI